MTRGGRQPELTRPGPVLGGGELGEGEVGTEHSVVVADRAFV